MIRVVSAALATLIAAATAYTGTFPRVAQVAPDSTGFLIRGGQVLGTAPPGYQFLAPYDAMVSIKTGIAIDRYRTRARLRDGQWWSFDVVLTNRWYQNATESEKVATFVNWYARHQHSGVSITKINPEGSPEVEMLRTALDVYVPCLLGTITMTDVVDGSAAALTLLSMRLLAAMRGQPIDIVDVRITPDSVEGEYGDDLASRAASVARVLVRRKWVSGDGDACVALLPNHGEQSGGTGLAPTQLSGVQSPAKRSAL